MSYRWATAYEWLKWKVDNGVYGTTELMLLCAGLDSDAIQDEFQSDMDKDGYFHDRGKTKPDGTEFGWVVRNAVTHRIMDDQFWLDDVGWTDLDLATVFTKREKNDTLKLPADGEWVEEKKAYIEVFGEMEADD